MRINSRRLHLLIVLTVALAFAGCNRKTIYHHYEHTPVAGWEKNDTLTFTVKAKERAVVQRDVELRISGEYPFQRLNLVIEQTTYPAGISRRDTLNCDLIDSQGNIQGQGLSLYQYRFHMTDISLNEGDSLCVNIRHNMKRELLSGVTDVGLRLRTY